MACEIGLRGMPLDLTDDKSTSAQVMAWCHQATSHYLSQCWPRSLSPYGITRPQWVNTPQLTATDFFVRSVPFPKQNISCVLLYVLIKPWHGRLAELPTMFWKYPPITWLEERWNFFCTILCLTLHGYILKKCPLSTIFDRSSARIIWLSLHGHCQYRQLSFIGFTVFDKLISPDHTIDGLEHSCNICSALAMEILLVFRKDIAHVKKRGGAAM